jgi:hypothetical protein
MYKSKVTRDIAEYILKTYPTMEGPMLEKDKMAIISKDVEKRFGEKFTPESLTPFTKKSYTDVKNERKARKNCRYKKRIEPLFSELKESVNVFEGGNIPEKISGENPYVKVLVVMRDLDYDIKGRKLSEKMGKSSVMKELRNLGRLGLVQDSSGVKKQISEKGKNYLESMGL